MPMSSGAPSSMSPHRPWSRWGLSWLLSGCRPGGVTASLTLVVVTVVVAMLGTAPATALRADSTPAPVPPGGPAVSCPTGQTPTQVTAPPPTKPVPTARKGATPNPASTTQPDGSVVTSACAIAPPTPMLGPQIPPEHTVGGPLLARSGVIVDAPVSVPPPPAVTDVSYVVSDLDTGQVLAAKNPHALLLPASTLKTLTSLVVLPALSTSMLVTASHEAVTAEGTRVGLIEGNPYTVDQLMTGLVLISGNDTAYALADAYGGRAKLIAAMNERAGQLGAWDTMAVDPSGLDAPGQRSSAYDLALIGRAVMQLPDFRRYALTRTFSFPGGTDAQGKVQPPFQIDNHNTLLDSYPGTFGVKNGYTSGARHTFIGAVSRGGRTLLVTQMGGVVVPSWQPTAALLDWAFANAGALRPVGQLVAPGAPQPPEWRGEAATPLPEAAVPGAGGTSTLPLRTPPAAAPRQESAGGVLTSGRETSTQPVVYAVLLALAAGLTALVLARRRAVRARRGRRAPGR